MPATSHFGVSLPHRWRFQALLSQSESLSAGRAPAAAGIAKSVDDAGAILKSPPVPPTVALLPDASLAFPAALASFCCAQSGRANSAPIATVTHHFRIASSPNRFKNFLVSTRLSLKCPLHW